MAGIMPVLAKVIFGLVQWASRRGFANVHASEGANAQRRSGRRTGIRGETFAYWYLRRHGYTIIARNFTVPGIKGEIDLVGYDGAVLAFIEVKTRTRRARHLRLARRRRHPGQTAPPFAHGAPISRRTTPARASVPFRCRGHRIAARPASCHSPAQRGV